jgi:copper chaperone CopZ
MTTVTLAVPTVHCRACKLNIEEALDDVTGVASSDVDIDAKTVSVTFDAAVLSSDEVVAAVTEAGYPASATA